MTWPRGRQLKKRHPSTTPSTPVPDEVLVPTAETPVHDEAHVTHLTWTASLAVHLLLPTKLTWSVPDLLIQEVA